MNHSIQYNVKLGRSPPCFKKLRFSKRNSGYTETNQDTQSRTSHFEELSSNKSPIIYRRKSIPFINRIWDWIK